MTDLYPLHFTNFKKPDIVSTLEKEGIALKEKNKSLWTLCPLHLERTPSFKVDPEKQTGHCFGCGFHGDVITFIQKLKGLNFQGALSYLGINGELYKPDLKETKKRELLKAFRQWCNNYHNDLCRLFRTLQKAKSKAKTIEEVETLSPFYYKESFWLYHVEILLGNNDEAKFELYMEIENERI